MGQALATTYMLATVASRRTEYIMTDTVSSFQRWSNLLGPCGGACFSMQGRMEGEMSAVGGDDNEETGGHETVRWRMNNRLGLNDCLL
jgi:hypothetical protein